MAYQPDSIKGHCEEASLITEIKGTGGFYGYIEVRKIDNDFEWAIPSYCDVKWSPISENLYNELIKHSEEYVQCQK